MGAIAATGRAGFLLASMLAMAACEASWAKLRETPTTQVHLPREVIWSEIVDLLHSRYRQVRFLELDATRLRTDWVESRHPFHLKADRRFGSESGDVVYRITVSLAGADPYRVAVDVQIGVWWSGPAPWPLPDSTQYPMWVPTLRKDLTRAIHERLIARAGPAR